MTWFKNLFFRRDRYYRADVWEARTWTVVIGVLLVIAVFFASLFALITWGVRYTGRVGCNSWGSKTGYKTEYRIMYWSDAGTCFAQLPNGHWLPKDKVSFVTVEKS